MGRTEFTGTVECPRCDGAGGWHHCHGPCAEPVTCPTCHGGGQVPLTEGLQAALEKLDEFGRLLAEAKREIKALQAKHDAQRRVIAGHAGEEYLSCQR